jgi:hypothetical protein
MMQANLHKLHQTPTGEGYPTPKMLFADVKSNANKGMKKLHGLMTVRSKASQITTLLEVGSEELPQTGFIEFMGFGAYNYSGNRYITIEIDGEIVFSFDDWINDEAGVIPIGMMAGTGAGISMSCIPFNKTLKVNVMNYESYFDTCLFFKLFVI